METEIIGTIHVVTHSLVRNDNNPFLLYSNRGVGLYSYCYCFSRFMNALDNNFLVFIRDISYNVHTLHCIEFYPRRPV